MSVHLCDRTSTVSQERECKGSPFPLALVTSYFTSALEWITHRPYRECRYVLNCKGEALFSPACIALNLLSAVSPFWNGQSRHPHVLYATKKMRQTEMWRSQRCSLLRLERLASMNVCRRNWALPFLVRELHRFLAIRRKLRSDRVSTRSWCFPAPRYVSSHQGSPHSLYLSVRQLRDPVFCHRLRLAQPEPLNQWLASRQRHPCSIAPGYSTNMLAPAGVARARRFLRNQCIRTKTCPHLPTCSPRTYPRAASLSHVMCK